jgi:SSS family solute:Na+ symporter
MLAAASIIAKNVLGDTFGIAVTPAAQTRATRILVLVAAVLAFGFWALAKTTLVGLLLIAYNGITQLFPGVALSFAPRRPNAAGVAAGIIAGIAVLAVCAARGISVVDGLNVGIAALAVNVALAAAIGYARPLGRAAEAGSAGG